MPEFSPIPSYVVGIACLGLSLSSFLTPAKEYPRFGLPLEPAESTSRHTSAKSNGSVSPLMYLKGIREATYGIALIALQYQGFHDAVTTMIAVTSLAGLGDSIVVWNYGGSTLRNKAFGHLFAFTGLAAWSFWRFTNN